MKLRSPDAIGSITLMRTVGSGWAKISSLRRWRWDSWDGDVNIWSQSVTSNTSKLIQYTDVYSVTGLQLSAHQHNSTELIAAASKATSSPAHSTQYMVQGFPVRLNLLISNKWLKIPYKYFQLNYGTTFHPIFCMFHLLKHTTPTATVSSSASLAAASLAFSDELDSALA